MKCPVCGCKDNIVKNTRYNEPGNYNIRRRECTKCGVRYSTYEIVDEYWGLVKNQVRVVERTK